MKKIFFAVALFAATCTFSQNIELPTPDTKGGKPLMEALNQRKSARGFSDKELTKQQLSDLLWAANGVNRAGEKPGRTAPSASNCQEIDMYVFLKTGIYFYDAVKHTLVLKKQGDFRKDAGKQPFAAKSALMLAFVANYDEMPNYKPDQKEFYGATDCGFVSQNVYLYCASEGLSTVVLGMVDKDAVFKLLELGNSKVILSQAVGVPAN